VTFPLRLVAAETGLGTRAVRLLETAGAVRARLARSVIPRLSRLFRARGRIGIRAHDRDLHADGAFNIAQEAALVVRAQGHRDAALSRAGRAADAVNVAFRNVRDVVVENVRDGVDV